MQYKLREWTQRYLPAEIVAVATTLIAAGSAYYFTQSHFVAAIAGTWGENCGYYGFMLLRDIRASHRQYRKQRKRYRVVALLRDIRNIVFEFSAAEWLDSGIIRPFLMYILPTIVGNFSLGILAGKLAADVVFYILAIAAYEFRKKLEQQR